MKKDERSYLLLIACLLTISLFLVNAKAGVSTNLTCNASKFVVNTTDSVELSYYLGDLQVKPVDIRWNVTAGELDTSTAGVKWKFSRVPEGEYRAVINVKAGSDSELSCHVRVFVSSQDLVTDSQRGGLARETGYALLKRGKREAPGYSAYSYLLLASKPDSRTEGKYRALLEAFISMVPEIKMLEDYVPPSELNISYVPVVKLPPKDLSDSELIDFLLINYDFGRARALLRSIPGEHRQGPYIVSSYKPIPGNKQITKPFLEHDLSLLQEDMTKRMVTEFLIQVSQEHIESKRMLQSVLLSMQNVVNTLAKAAPDVFEARNKLVKYFM